MLPVRLSPLLEQWLSRSLVEEAGPRSSLIHVTEFGSCGGDAGLSPLGLNFASGLHPGGGSLDGTLAR